MILDMFKLENKLAVITGGAGLLGFKHAEALLEAGCEVILLDVNDQKLEDSERRLGVKHIAKIHSMNVDITKLQAVVDAKNQIAKKFNKCPDILINNAAIDPKFDKSPDQSQSDKPLSRFENFLPEQWDMEISVGLTGAMLCTRVFGFEMAKKGKGVILNIASDLGVVAPDQRIYRKEGVAEDMQNVKPVTYSVIKHGLIGLTKYTATYWAQEGVRCNAFAPGGVFNNHADDFLKKLTNLIPMGRMANIDEYKAAVLFLVSDASSYMTGATLNMDGGRSAW